MEPSQLIDISVPLGPQTPVWPGSDPVRVWRVQDFGAENGHAVSQLELGAHAGTHLDAPHHFLRDGATLDRIALERLVGPCRVLDVSAAGTTGVIGADALRAAGFDGVERPARVLLRTRAEGYWDETLPFDRTFPGLDESAARLLTGAGVGLVGVDAPSVEPFDSEGNPVHEILLSAGVVLLETLRLSHVPPGRYELICLPPAFVGVEGAPCRAVLRVH